MKGASLVLPITSIIATLITTVVMLVFSVAGAANASAEQLRSMKLQAGGMTVLAIVGIVGAIVCLRMGHPGWAAVAAIVPAAVMVLAFIVAIAR